MKRLFGLTFIYISLVIILICPFSTSGNSMNNANVSISFTKPDYIFEIRNNEPQNTSINGKVLCESYAREVVISLSVVGGSLDCSIEPELMSFPRGSSEQPFTVNIVMPTGNPFNITGTIIVGGQYEYFPGPSLRYNIDSVQANIEFINATSNSNEMNSFSDINEEPNRNDNIIIYVGFLIIIIIVTIILVIIKKRKK